MGVRDNTVKIKGHKGILLKDTDNRFEGRKEIDPAIDFPGKKALPKITFVCRTTTRHYDTGREKYLDKHHYETFTYEGKTFTSALKAVTDARTIWADEKAKEDPELRAENNRKRAFAETWDDYLRFKEASVSPHYIKTLRSFVNRNIFENPIDRSKTDLADRSIKKLILRDFQACMKRMNEAGASPRTQKAIRDFLHPFFEWCADNRYLDGNPVAKLQTPRFDNRRHFTLPIEQAQKLYQVITTRPDPAYRGIFTFLLHGRRLNEVLTLKWKNVSFEQDSYVIESQYSKTRYTQVQPLTGILKSVLVDLPKDNELVFPSEVTGGLRTTPKREWRKILDEAGIAKMRIHDLRHMVGYLSVNAGLSLETIGRSLGHRHSGTTSRYSTVDLETSRGVNETVLKILQKK